MSNIQDIAKKRSLPGVLVLDLQDRLLSINQEAERMLPVLLNGSRADLYHKISVLTEIRKLSAMVKEAAERPATDPGDEDIPQFLYDQAGETFCMRAFPLRDSEDSGLNQIMILVERIVGRHEIDFTKVGQEFKLSRRKVEVLKLVSRGLGNKEISNKMCISEYTVKDHLKEIMTAMNAGSRSEIIAVLNEKYL